MHKSSPVEFDSFRADLEALRNFFGVLALRNEVQDRLLAESQLHDRRFAVSKIIPAGFLKDLPFLAMSERSAIFGPPNTKKKILLRMLQNYRETLRKHPNGLP